MSKMVALLGTLCPAGLLAASSVAGLSMGSPSKWDNLQVGLTYQLYQPKVTLAKKLTSLKGLSCGQGHDEWAAGLYGGYNGTLGSKKHGFAIYEGHPICSNAGTSAKVGTAKVQGVQARVGVYCDTTTGCTKADGLKNGFTIQWKAPKSKRYHNKRTQMQLDSSHLTLTQLLRVAHSLKAV